MSAWLRATSCEGRICTLGRNVLSTFYIEAADYVLVPVAVPWANIAKPSFSEAAIISQKWASFPP